MGVIRLHWFVIVDVNFAGMSVTIVIGLEKGLNRRRLGDDDLNGPDGHDRHHRHYCHAVSRAGAGRWGCNRRGGWTARGQAEGCTWLERMENLFQGQGELLRIANSFVGANRFGC
jgi:hypothetical protein